MFIRHDMAATYSVRMKVGCMRPTLAYWFNTEERKLGIVPAIAELSDL